MHALLQPGSARTLTRHNARYDPPRLDRRDTNRPVASLNYALEFVADAFCALRPSACVRLAPRLSAAGVPRRCSGHIRSSQRHEQVPSADHETMAPSISRPMASGEAVTMVDGRAWSCSMGQRGGVGSLIGYRPTVQDPFWLVLGLATP
jgi:hypothetical protein